LKKIVLLQAAYYVSAIILIVFTVLVAGKPLSLDLLLSWRTIRGDTTVGWMLALVWLLNSLVRFVDIMV
jgi:protein SYS1